MSYFSTNFEVSDFETNFGKKYVLIFFMKFDILDQI